MQDTRQSQSQTLAKTAMIDPKLMQKKMLHFAGDRRTATVSDWALAVGQCLDVFIAPVRHFSLKIVPPWLAQMSDRGQADGEEDLKSEMVIESEVGPPVSQCAMWRGP